MKINLISLFTIFSVSYSSFVYSDSDHVLFSRIDLVQGKEIFGNGVMQSVVRIRYTLDKDVTLESIILKEFGTGVSLDDYNWTVTETDNGFDHNIGNRNRNIATPASPKSNEKYEIKYISSTEQNSQRNICYEMKTKKDANEETYSTCLSDDAINGSINIFSRRPKYYSANDFQFIKEKVIQSIYRELVSTYYTLKHGVNIPDSMFFKINPLQYSIPEHTSLTEGKVVSQRMFNQQDVKENNSGYAFMLAPNIIYRIKLYSVSSTSADEVYEMVIFKTRAADYSALHIIGSYLTNTATYSGSDICMQLVTEVNRGYYCRNQETGKRSQKTWAEVQKDRIEKKTEEILIDNYGTKHKINISIDDNGKPTL